jgi:hypothetical protein
MNTIEFKARVDKDEEGTLSLSADILIDGGLPDDLKPYCIDMYPIKESIDLLGAFGCDIFTCGCGIAECAGIWKRMLVITDETTVQWFVRWPIFRHYIFDKQQYKSAFDAFRNEAVSLAGGIQTAKEMEHYSCVSADELFDDNQVYQAVASEHRVELHEAVEYEDIETVKILVEKGYRSINHVNDRGETPLMLSKTLEMVKLLLSYGADINKNASKGNDTLTVISHSIYGCYDGNNLRYSDEQAEKIIEEIKQILIGN